MPWSEVFAQPAVVGALIGAFSTLTVGGLGWGYNLWLKKAERAAQHQGFTTEALKAQLEGWVNYSQQLNEQIGGLRQVIGEKDDRIASLERDRSTKEGEITELWRRIRLLESRVTGPPMDATVLVVDDNHEHARTVERMLRSIGLKPYSVHSSEEAEEYICYDQFQLIVMDISLDGRSGDQVAEDARKRGCEIPIIALSGFTHVVDQMKMSGAQFAAVIAKPVRAAEFLDIVRRTLGLNTDGGKDHA